MLADHIAVCERRARHARGLAAITPQAEVARVALKSAALDERMALNLAGRLSRISESLLAIGT